MTINERILLIINTLYNGNKSAFAKAICVAPSVVDNIVGKRQGKPSYDVIEKISALAEVNLNWLIAEKGELMDFHSRAVQTKPDPEPVANTQTPGLESKLLDMLTEKDRIIRGQAEEIGTLRERIKQLEQRLEKTADGANIAHTANVG